MGCEIRRENQRFKLPTDDSNESSRNVIELTTTIAHVSTSRVARKRPKWLLHWNLGNLDLKYVVHDEVLLITTSEKAANMVEPRVYMAGDLLNRRGPFGLPIRRVAWPLRSPVALPPLGPALDFDNERGDR